MQPGLKQRFQVSPRVQTNYARGIVERFEEIVFEIQDLPARRWGFPKIALLKLLGRLTHRSYRSSPLIYRTRFRVWEARKQR